MEHRSGTSTNLYDLLACNRGGLIWFFCLSVLGLALGRALFTSLYGAELGALRSLTAVSEAEREPLPLLLAGLLPPLVYGASMMICSFSPWLLPLWGMTVLAESCRWGMRLGLIYRLLSIKGALPAALILVLSLLVWPPVACLLAQQPLARLKRPRDPFGFDDVTGDVLTTAIPTMAAAAAGTVLTSLTCGLLAR